MKKNHGIVCSNCLNYVNMVDMETLQCDECLKLNQGKKSDQGKPDLFLLPTEAKRAIAKVLSFGAKKYGRDNWKKGINWSRLLSAAERHLDEFKEGRNQDEESGEHPLAHAAANLMFLLYYVEHKKEYDDRFKELDNKD